MRSWTVIIHSLIHEKDCVFTVSETPVPASFLLWASIKPRTSMDSVISTAIKETTWFWPFLPSLACLPFSLFVLLSSFQFQSLSNCGSQGSGWDEVLSLSRAKTTASYLSTMLQASTCCSYMGKELDMLPVECWGVGEDFRSPHTGTRVRIVWNEQQWTISSPPLQLDESTRWKTTYKASTTVIFCWFFNMCLPSMFENKTKQNKIFRKPGKAELQLGFSHMRAKQTTHIVRLSLHCLR